MRPEIAHLFSLTGPQGKSTFVKHASALPLGVSPWQPCWWARMESSHQGLWSNKLILERERKDDLKGVKIQQQTSRFTFRPKTKEGGNTQFKWTLPSPHWETYIHTLANSQSTFCCYLLNPWQVLDGEGMAIHPVFLPGESPWTEEPGGLQSIWLDMTEVTEHSIA